MKKFWKWKNKMVMNQETMEQTQERTLYLNGTIAEESWFDDDVTPQLFKDELNAGSGDITVWINSPGGDCVAAAQIYNMLIEYKGNVNIKIDGIAASAASVIAMAGTKVYVSPVSMMMIHNPMIVAWGNKDEMEKAISMLSEVKESIINAYEIKTGLSRSKISHLMDAETWMNAHSAVELGFADEILKRNIADEDEEDAKTYAEMEKKIKNYGLEIERMEQMDAMENELKKPLNTPIVARPITDKPKDVKTGRASDEYKEGMLTALRTNFRQIANVLQEGVDADGGYLVPEEYDNRLIDVLSEENIMRKLGHKITTFGEHKINIAATKPAAAWIEEGGALQFGDATFDQILLDAHKLHVAIKVTEELLYDNAFGLENYIIDQFGKALANAEEDAFLNGSGVGQPLGLFAENGGGTVAESTTTLKADDIINLVYALKRPYRKNASFIMNDQTIAAIRTLKDNNGAFMWQPALTQGEPDRLLGYAVHTSPFCPTDGIAFGDYQYYNIGDRGTRSFKQLTELLAGNGMIGFVAKERVDGKLILPEAVQILKIGTKASTSKAGA